MKNLIISSSSKFSSNACFLVSLLIGILGLTGCPEISKVDQPEYAFPGDTIEVELEFVVKPDDWNIEGFWECRTPKDWSVLELGFLKGDTSGFTIPILKSEGDWDGDRDLENVNYWRSNHDAGLPSPLSYGTFKVAVGSIPGKYYMQYALGDQYWGGGYLTGKVQIDVIKSEYAPWKLGRTKNNVITWEAPKNMEEISGFNIYKNGYLLRYNQADTFFIDPQSISGVNSYIVSSLSNRNKETFCAYDVKVMYGDTVFVSPEGNDYLNWGSRKAPLKTITHAMEIVVADSINPKVVRLLPGVYSPSKTNEVYPIHMKDYVHLMGDPVEETVLDAEMSAGIIDITATSNSISHLSLINGANDQGSAVRISSEYQFKVDDFKDVRSTVNLSNLIVKDNHSEYGSISGYSSTVSMQNVVVAENISGVQFHGCALEINNCTITKNRVRGSSFNGYDESSPIQIQNSIIRDKTVEFDFDSEVDWNGISYCNIGVDIPYDLNIGTNSSYVDTDSTFYQLDITSREIDAGNPKQDFNDLKLSSSTNDAMYPSLGSLRNDMGAYGGPYASYKVLNYTLNNKKLPYVDGDTIIRIREHQRWNSPFFKSYEPMIWQLSGKDSQFFELRHGEQHARIMFLTAPDYENPMDIDQDNIYELVLSVITESGVLRNMAVTIEISDYDETPPSIFGPESIQHTENVLSVAKYRTDKGVKWRLEGDDYESFIILDDGSLFFRIIPNAETPRDLDGDNIYEINIVAEDELNNRELIEVQIEVIHEVVLSIENSLDNEINVYPVPAVDHVTIDYPSQFDLKKITIVNLSGQEVYTQEKRFTNRFDFPKLSSGVYLLMAQFDTVDYTKRIIIHE